MKNPNVGNTKNKKTPLSLNAIRKLEELEYNFCQYVDTAFPKKFRHTYVAQILNCFSLAMSEGLVGFSHDSDIFAEEKLDHISHAIGHVCHIQTCLNRLNDLGQISDNTKALLDMKLAEILDGLTRFSSSLRNKISIAGRNP